MTLLEELAKIERRLAERLAASGRSTVRYAEDDATNYGAWISTRGVEVDVDSWEHLDAARAILLDAGFSVPDIEDDSESGNHLLKLGFIRVIYPATYGDRDFSIELGRQPTEAQLAALERVVRTAHRLQKRLREMWIDTYEGRTGSKRISATYEALVAALSSQ